MFLDFNSQKSCAAKMVVKASGSCSPRTFGVPRLGTTDLGQRKETIIMMMPYRFTGWCICISSRQKVKEDMGLCCIILNCFYCFLIVLLYFATLLAAAEVASKENRGFHGGVCCDPSANCNFCKKFPDTYCSVPSSVSTSKSPLFQQFLSSPGDFVKYFHSLRTGWF